MLFLLIVYCFLLLLVVVSCLFLFFGLFPKPKVLTRTAMPAMVAKIHVPFP